MTDNPYTIRLDEKSTGPEGPYLIWYWDGHASSYSVAVQYSLEDALLMAWDNENYYASSVHSIEGPAGEIGPATLHAWIDHRKRKAVEKQRREDESHRSQPLYTVMVRRLDGIESFYANMWDKDLALRVADELPAGRVRIYAGIGMEPDRVFRDWDGTLS